MLSKRHVVVWDEYGSISSGRFIFLAVISSHDPPHVAYRLEFIFSGRRCGGVGQKRRQTEIANRASRSLISRSQVKSGEMGGRVGVCCPPRVP